MHIVHGVPGTFPRDMAWRIGEEMKHLSLSAWLLLRCLQFALEFEVVHFAGRRGGHNPDKNSQSNEREPATSSTTCDISSGNRTQITASAYNAALSLVPAPLLQGSTG